MENNLYYESACKSLLKQQESKRLFQILVVIRKGLNDKHLCEERIKQLTKLGCIRNITLCLQQESVAILDVTLSLIGNACINYNFCLELLKFGILHTLNRLLERCQKDSIQGRAFRIIGNLCDNTCSHSMMLKEQELVPKIVKYVIKCSDDDESESCVHDENGPVTEGSLIMAIRALRKLLKQSTLRLLVEKYNVLNGIGLLLIKYKKLWIENNQNKIIVDDILRLLYAYSRFSYPGMLSSITTTEKGNALYCLVDLFDFQAFRIIKMIMNWTKSVSLRTELPIKELCNTLFERVEKKQDLQMRRKYLCFLNTLMEEPGYRQYVNSLEYSNLLVDVLKGLQTRDNCSIQSSMLVLSIFKKCNNDQLAVRNQINAGAVGALIDKLEWCGKSCKEITTIEHGKKKRTRPHSEEKSKKYKISDSYLSKFVVEGYLRNNFDNRCASPSELSDISSDGPNSPSCSAIREDICDSDNYSPVCSDTEDIEVQSLRSLEPSGGYESASEEETLPISKTLTELINEINSLICGYSRVSPVSAELGNPKLLTMLVNLWIGSEKLHPTPSQVLTSLLRHQEFLIPLLQTNFIYNVHSKMTTVHNSITCTTCNHLLMVAENVVSLLSCLAESEIGKGDIAHILIRSNDDLKQKVAIHIPYLTSSKMLLTKLMINCGGLKLVISAVNKTDVTQEIIRSLHLLAGCYLQKKNPICDLNSKCIQILKPDDYSKCNDVEPENLVLFKFEDSEELVPVDREFLRTKSDYFNGLLYGNFRESIEREVNMVGIKSAAFKSLLLLLKYKRDETCVKLDLDIMLELLEMTDRYLLPDLHVYLTECVEHIYMNKESMPVIYQWSIESRTNILRVECVVFALTSKMMDNERFNIFQHLIDLNYNEQLIDDISKLLVRFMMR